MNKTVAFVVIGIIALGGVLGSVILTLERPDATATFISQVVLLLGIVTTAAGTLYGLGKVGEKVEEIKKQTNGTLSRRDDKIDALEAELAELRAAENRRFTGAHRI